MEISVEQLIGFVAAIISLLAGVVFKSMWSAHMAKIELYGQDIKSLVSNMADFKTDIALIKATAAEFTKMREQMNKQDRQLAKGWDEQRKMEARLDKLEAKARDS